MPARCNKPISASQNTKDDPGGKTLPDAEKNPFLSAASDRKGYDDRFYCYLLDESWRTGKPRKLAGEGSLGSRSCDATTPGFVSVLAQGEVIVGAPKMCFLAAAFPRATPAQGKFSRFTDAAASFDNARFFSMFPSIYKLLRGTLPTLSSSTLLLPLEKSSFPCNTIRRRLVFLKMPSLASLILVTRKP